MRLFEYKLKKPYRYEYPTNTGRDNLFSSRALLNQIVSEFSNCKTKSAKRDYIEKSKNDKDIDKALEIFSWFHYTQQKVLYDKILDEVLEFKEYRKSLKHERSHRNNGNK